nr:hypothetical protein [Cytophagales bacterium]
MKNAILVVLLLVSFYCPAQESIDNGEKAIIEKVNQFFEALEKQDTTLFASLAYADAEIWTVRRRQDSVRIGHRNYSDDTKNFDPKRVIYERALRYDIQLHQDIAVAWVPYTLHVNQDFSHCGVDVFTFLRTNDGWKIVSLAYSIEPDGC